MQKRERGGGEREGKKRELAWVSKHVMKNSARQALEKVPSYAN